MALIYIVEMEMGYDLNFLVTRSSRSLLFVSPLMFLSAMDNEDV